MTAEYHDLREELQTGDLVLWSGKGKFSAIIKAGTFCKWSHVGIIVNLKAYNFVTMWESTTGGCTYDLESGVIRNGVQLVPLSARVQEYSGDIAIRKLYGPNKQRDWFHEDQLQSLWKLRKDLRNKPYYNPDGDNPGDLEDSTWKQKLELFKAVYDGIWGDNKEDLSGVFCSELVAEAYKCLGLLPQEIPSNEYTPADFSSSKERLKLLSGYSLGEEIPVEYDETRQL